MPTKCTITNLALSYQSNELYGCNGEKNIYIWSLSDRDSERIIETETIIMFLFLTMTGPKCTLEEIVLLMCGTSVLQ